MSTSPCLTIKLPDGLGGTNFNLIGSFRKLCGVGLNTESFF
ncbi:MAG TPA: hypothetical protein DEH15_02145 [Marinilabiliales bacterium]|nr:hypothetical protein [Marinilabiliales bacterium]